jgi:nicotinamidase-related amidase
MRHQNIIDQQNVTLVIIDMQEGFRSAIHDFAETSARIALITHAALLLGLPTIITEQYPKGLGNTASEIRTVLPPEYSVISKTAFSACDSPEFLNRINGTGTSNVLLCGIEAHICVCQTALDLLTRGFRVHYLADCISSRVESNREIGLSKMQQSGIIPSSTEMALFEILRDSKNERFKSIQRLIK